jgi:hypothetical protein
MMLVPGATPVTNPVVLTVATDVVPDTHGLVAAGVPEPFNCVVAPTQTLSVPVIVGRALTVTVTVAAQPRLFVYVMMLVPAPTPVTTPVLLIVATDVVPDTHGFVAAGVPDPVNAVVDPTQTVKVPEIVGEALTVTVADFEQPALFV